MREYKKYLLEHRLQRFVGEDKQFKTHEEFYRALVCDETHNLRREFINALTTNYTYFFRDAVHFQFLSYYLKTKAPKEAYVRFWSAGCSTGEEAYSAAMTCLENGNASNKMDVKILATDISQKVLTKARQGLFHYSQVGRCVSDSMLRMYFEFDSKGKVFSICDAVKSLVTFRYLNLMDSYPFRRSFDVVFLRNVLIYFDAKEKEQILTSIWSVLKIGGYLMLGLSESLIGVQHPFTPLKYSIYRKDRKV